MSLKKAAACVKKHKRFLITAHTTPEGDALGSELAFCRMLKALGKEALVVNHDAVPYGYDFFPGVNNIKKFEDGLNVEFECLVILDCSDLGRCGRVAELDLKGKVILNIDHHISNELFAEVNWVDPHCSSTAEMVYRLYKALGLVLDKDIALLLYAGIMTDTGSFRYANTSSATHRIAAQLLRYGLDTAQIYKNIYGNIPFQDMRLLSRILPGMRREAAGRIIWFQIKKELLRHRKLSFDLSENILSFARLVQGAEVVVLFKENLGVKDEIRVNFRSQGKVDVNKIAGLFGGGGHRAASGATIRGRIDSVRRKVLAKIREAL